MIFDAHPQILADFALVPPELYTSPSPRYDYAHLDYGMTIGIERTKGGRLWACWVGGGDSELAFFLLARSDDLGNSWSAPQLVIDPHDRRLPLARRTIVGNLWLDPSGRLWLFFDQAMTFFDGRAGTWFTRCDDPDADQPAWTPPCRIWHGCALNPPLILSSGEWLLPVSLWDRRRIHPPFENSFTELDQYRMTNLLVSTDQGESWHRRGGVAMPEPDFDEPQVVERRDGTLWLTARTGLGLWESFSEDRGAHWFSPRPSSIANANTRHFLRRLRSGRLLLVKHGEKIGECPREPGGRFLRSHLAAFLSDDDGASWQGALLLDERSGVSYPDGTQLDDGSILVSYDCQRDEKGHILFARFTEAEVLAGTIECRESFLKRLICAPNPVAVAARLAASSAKQQG